MADDSFVHDESMFDPGERKSAVEISDAEAKYAELFREVIWDGVITADERVRLDTAAEVFGLAAGRAAQIEQALSAEYEVRHQVRLVHDEGGEPDLDWGGPGAGEGPPAVPAPAQPVAPASLPSAPDAGAVAPLAVAEDPGQRALQRRIEVLEAQNRELEQYGRELETRCAMLDAQGAELERRCECYEERVAALTEELAAARGAGPSAPAGTPAPAPADAEPVSPAPAPEPAPAVGAAVP
ncbi:MAG: hypothetical protein HY744_29305, partial [Deltaproteobacteria bacterium]|nr:hypothetical protein [Deltaproteobacteria bacterium]